MEFSEGFESVGEFEFEAGGFVDSSGDFHLIIDGWGQEVEFDFIDPFAAILSADLEIGHDIFGFEGQNAHVVQNFI